MASNTRIYNETRHYYMNRKQAAKAVENCACAWIQFGVSVRDLTLAESIVARNHQAHDRVPLPMAEQPGIVYRPAEKDVAGYRQEIRLMRDANEFAAMVG